MTPPALEIADLIRTAGAAFVERNRQWIRWRHVKVLLAIARCRTAALGGHLDECIRCAHRAPISYNSCRDRHCPKCQTAAREQWIAARQKELLPTRYMHVVFTLPRRLAPLVLQNKKVLYDLLFRTSAETLLEVARDPRLLGAELGFFSVLHTWSQQLRIHPHVHCVIPAGGLSPDHTRWIRSREKYFLPKAVLAEVFRGKFVDALKLAFQDGQLNFQANLKLLAQPKIFAAWLRPLHRQDWVACHDSATLLSAAGRDTPVIRLFLRRFPPTVSLPQVRRTDEGHRTADGCRPSTSFPSTGHRSGMKRPPPTPTLRVLRRAQLSSVLLPNTTLPLASLTHRFRHNFSRASSFTRIPVAVALRSSTSTHLRAAPSHL